MSIHSFVSVWLRNLKNGLARGRSRGPRRPSQPRAWLHVESLEVRLAPAQVNWIGPATGDWNTAGYWSSGSVPGVSDTAYIGSGNTVTFSSSDTYRVTGLDVDGALQITGGNLTIGNTAGSNLTVTTGGTVSGAGMIAVSNGAANTWSGGTMTGTGNTTFASGSTLTLSGSTDVLAGGRNLGGTGGATLTGELNAGTGGGTLNFSALQWSSGGNVDLAGNTLTNAGTMTLTSSATVSLYANLYYTGSGSYDLGGTFINTGTFVQQGAGSLEMYDNVILSNQGTYQFSNDSNILYGNAAPNSFVNSSTGIVKKTTTAGTSSIEVPFDNQGGTLDAESGTLQATDGGTNTGGTYDANGSGVVDLTGGSSTTFTGTYTGSGTGRVQLASSTLTIGSAGATFNFPNGLFVFSGGTLNGTLTNAHTGFVTITGGTLGGTLNNQGTILQPSGTLTLNGSLSNTGTYDIALTTSGNATTASGTFTNTSTGLLELTTNVTATLKSPFANQGGTVETTAAVTSGTLVLGGGGTSTGGTYDTLAAGGAIDLAGAATSVLTGTYTGTGAGLIELSLGGSLAPGSSGATLDFTTESFQISNGGLNMQGNTLTNAGTLTLTDASNATVHLYANLYYTGSGSYDLGGTLLNTGTFVQQGAGGMEMYDNTVLRNQGTYQFSSDSNIYYGSAAPNSFVNSSTGIVKKTTTAGTSSIEVPFDNQGGTLDAESGTLQATDGGTNTGGTYDANGSGVVDLTGGSSTTFTGTYTGSGTGRVQLASSTLTIGSAGATFNFPSGLFVFSGGTLNGTLTNASTGTIAIKGGTLGGTLINQGTLLQPSGTLTLNGSLSNTSTYDVALAASGTVTTGSGIFTNTSTGTLELTTNVVATLLSPFANQGGTVETTAAVTSGTLVLGGGGTSTGGTYDAVAAGGAIDLAGAATSVLTGTYTGTGAGLIELSLGGSLAPGSGGATLDFTTESFQISNGGLNMQGNTLTNAGTITLTNTASLTLHLYANLYYTGSGSYNLGGTLTNTGTIVEGLGALEMYDNVILNNQGTYQFTSNSGLIYGNAAPRAVVNTGTIEKTGGTGTTTIGIPFDNQGGTVEAESGTLSLSNGGTSTGGSYLAIGSSSVVNLTGGSSPTFTGTYTGSGSGQIEMTGGTIIIGSGGATFNFPNGLFAWSGGTLNGTLTNASTGFLPVSGTSPGGTFNNLGTMSQTGNTLNVVNSGTFTVSSGTVNLSGGSGGTLTENSSTVNVQSGTYAGVDELTGSGGTYNFTGSLTNNGTLSLTGSTVSPAYELEGGTILGGTLTTSSGAQLAANQSGGTLNGVTLGGTLWIGQIRNTYVDVTGGLTLAANSLVTMQGNAELIFLGSQSLNGSGTVDFADNINVADSFNPSGVKGLYVPTAGNTLTVGAGVTVHGITGFVGSTSSGFVTNNGTIDADGGGTITVQGDTNYTAGTLTGGTWEASGSSTLVLTGANISTNDASIILNGTNSAFTDQNGNNALASLATNAAGGSLTLLGNRSLTTSGAFVNSGSVTLGPNNTAAGTLIADYPFDSDAATDTSGYGNNGTFSSNPPTFTSSGFQNGALKFTATSDNYVTVPVNINPNTTPELTMGGWFNASSLVTSSGVIRGLLSADTGGYTRTLDVDTRGGSGLRWSAFTGSGVLGGTIVASNQWTFVVVRYNATTGQIVLNVNGNEFSTTGEPGNAATTTTIGRNPNFDSPFDGLIDNVFIYDTFLSDTQIAAIYTAGAPFQIIPTSTLTASGGYTQLAGSTTLLGGLLASSSAIDFNGGTLTGNGTIAGNVLNAAQVALGTPTGTLAVIGNYTQTAAGTLSLDVGGTTVGSQYDQLTVSGTATFAGTLDVSLTNGFGPTVPQVFSVVTAQGGISGSLATTNLPSVDGVTAFEVQTVQGPPANLNLVATINSPDLAAVGDSITVNNENPANTTGITGQDITVGYTIDNLSPNPAFGSWTDSVYLSADGMLDASSLLLGRVGHTGGLAGLSSYNSSLTALVPDLSPGAFEIIVVTDSELQEPDLNRANNTGISSSPLLVTVPTLTFGTPVSGTLAAGESIGYRFTVPIGQDVQVGVNFGVAREAMFLTNENSLPTLTSYGQEYPTPADLDQLILLSGSQPGVYYVLLQGQGAAAAGKPYTIEAQVAPFMIQGFDVKSSNLAATTLELTGSGFTPQTTASLLGTSLNSITASSVSFVDSNHIFATFNLTNQPATAYAVLATQGGQTVAAPASFNNLGTAVLPNAIVRISSPAIVEVGQMIPVLIVAANPSSTEPAFGPTASFAGYNMVGAVIANGPNGLQVFTSTQFIISFGEDGELLPGEVDRFELTTFPTPVAPHIVSTYTLGVINSNTPVDWTDAKPANISAAAWTAMLPNLIASLGTTYGQLLAALQADILYFQELGETVTSMDQLMAFEFAKAEDSIPSPVLATSTDLSVSTTGLALSLTRNDVNTIPGRYQLGSFGYGWTFVGDDTVTTQMAQGQTSGPPAYVTVQESGAARTFTLQTDGSYQGAPGDPGTLQIINGFYIVTEPSGTVEWFNPNGTFQAVADANGNIIEAAYTGTRMTNLTEYNSSFVLQGSLSFTYNSAGRIVAATASTGETVTYNYDATNSYLLSVDGPDATVSYTYNTSPGNPSTENALLSITHPDGTHSYFSYDSAGRLMNEKGDDGTGSITLAYLSPAGYTVTDANNDTSTVLVGAEGQSAKIVDPEGNVYLYVYDSNGNLSYTVLPNGKTVSYQYNPVGDQTSVTDALGSTVEETYNQQFNTLASLTDANSDQTTFGYNNQGDLTSITAADGSITQLVPNAAGEVQEVINANGQTTSDTYNSFGEVTSASFSNGVEYSYSYDGHGNLLTATDPTGTTTFAYTDPNHPDLVTGVTYPNGMFLQYSYTQGGQLAQLDQNGYIVNYSYDADGRLSALTDANGGSIISYEYNKADQLIQGTMGNGTYTTYTYFSTGAVQSIVNYAPGGTINSEFDYTYDDLGRVATVTTLDGTTTYGYDADSQLISVAPPNGPMITYGYDSMGNRTTMTENGVTTNYTSNDLNEYIAVGGAIYSYDKDGNLRMTTGPGGTTTYTYNVQNQLIGVQTPTDTWTYTYDALGNLVASSDNGQTTRYLVNPVGNDNVVGEYDGSGNLIANYSYGIGLTSQVSSGGTATYYDFDASGDTAGLTGSAGSYVDSYSYLPFGEVQSATGTVANPFQYGGQFGVMAQGSGLDFMRARFYQSSNGRFLNGDPLGLEGGTNVYTYAGNDPVNYGDPSGYAPTPFQLLRIATALLKLANQTPTTSPNLGPTYDPPAIAPDTPTITGPPPPEGSLPALPDNITTAEPEPVAEAETVAETESAVEAETVVDGATVTTGGEAGFVLLEVIAPIAAFAAGGAVGYGIARYWDAHDPQSLIAFGGGIVHLLDFLSAGLINLEPQIARPVQSQTEQVAPQDPNFISGPAGSGPQGFVPAATPMPYQIGFENEANASAPAQVVEVTQQLDPNLDWSTFQLGSFGFGGLTYSVPAGLTSYTTVIDARSTVGVYVDVSAQFNPLTGLLTWTFTSLDPATLDVPIGNPEEGFLPPNVTAPEGEGWVSYVVQPKAGDTTGTVINAQATVLFNAGLPDQSSLATAPIINTIDAGAPTSSVSSLPTFSPATFTVNWAGQDDPGGSGIATYDVYVSDDDGPFTLWQSATTQTSAQYLGQNGHTYAFSSVATDNVGNVQPTPLAAQASTTVNTSTTTAVQSSGNPSIYGQTVTFAAVVSPASSGTPTGQVDFYDSTTNTDLGQATLQCLNGEQVATISTAALTAVSHTIVANYLGDGTFLSSQNSDDTSNTITQTVTPAALTITATNVTMTYADGTTLNGSTGFTESGLVGSDSISSVSLATNATLSTSGHWNVGTWSITPSSAVGSGLSNYSIIYQNAPIGLTVKALALTVSGLTANNKPYDGTTTATITNSNDKLVSVIPSDVVTLVTSSTANFSSANVGTWLVTGSGFSISGADAADYSLSQPTATAQIIPASPAFSSLTASQTITAGTSSITLSGTLKAGALAVSPGETVTITIGSLSANVAVGSNGSFSTSFSAASLAASNSPYTISYSYAGDGNFNSASDSSTTLTVNSGGSINVTGQVQVTYGGMFHVAGSRASSAYQFTESLTLTNTSSVAISGPIYLEVSIQGATLANQSGTSASNGLAYLLVSSTGLAAGASINVTLDYYDPALASILIDITKTTLWAGGPPL